MGTIKDESKQYDYKPNLILVLQRTSGLGVSPHLYSSISSIDDDDECEKMHCD